MVENHVISAISALKEPFGPLSHEFLKAHGGLRGSHVTLAGHFGVGSPVRVDHHGVDRRSLYRDLPHAETGVLKLHESWLSMHPSHGQLQPGIILLIWAKACLSCEEQARILFPVSLTC